MSYKNTAKGSADVLAKTEMQRQHVRIATALYIGTHSTARVNALTSSSALLDLSSIDLLAGNDTWHYINANSTVTVGNNNKHKQTFIKINKLFESFNI